MWLKDNLPPLLAIITALGFISLLWLLAFHEPPESSHDMLTAMIGWLGSAFATVIGYWFGSSAGSSKKTDALIESGKDGKI